MTLTQPLSILIIDDNPGDQILLRENLENTSLLIKELVFADTLKEGIDAVNAQDFSLVFLDLFLPDSFGLNSLAEINKIDAKVPIIIYSGSADTQIALTAITMGAQDFLIKGDYTNTLLQKTVTYSIERKKNLDALEVSNNKYVMLSKATHDMIWEWDLVSNIVHRNIEGWRKIFKTTEGAITNVSEDWANRIHPDDREKIEDTVKKAIANIDQEQFEVEFKITCDDGTIGCLEDRGFIIRNPEGVAIQIIGASHDITDRKNAETLVRQSEDRFKSLVQNSNDLLAILDSTGLYTYVSPTSFNLLGFPPEHFIGKNAFDFIHPDDQELTSSTLSTAMTGNQFVTVPVFRFRNSAGNWRWIESTISNRLDDPAIKGVVVNSRDVTEKKIADDEIRKLSLVAKNAASSIFILNKQREITWVNDAFTKITGYDYAESKGQLPSLLLFHPDSEAVNFKEIFEKINAGSIYEAERLIKTKSGKAAYVWLQLQTLFGEHGEADQYFGMQTDITEKKELEEKLRLDKVLMQKQITEAVYGAQESERSEIGRELHDNVNQLLGAIKLYVNMAKTDEEDRESLLNDASEFTLTAIEEIRKLSKTLITPLIKEVGLVDSIKELANEIMAVHPLRIFVLADKFRDDEFDDKFKLNMFRICQEQVNNILKHADALETRIIISVNDELYQMSIIDNGVGFDTNKRKNGVGLTNIKSRCELYNGVVAITSEPGRGTKLSITFTDSLLLKKPVLVSVSV